MELLEQLSEVVTSSAISTVPQILAQYEVDGIRPAAVVYPEQKEQAAAVLTFANQHQLKVGIRGGGTHTNLGNPIEALDIVISTSRLNRIFEYSPADLMVGLEAGADLAMVRAELAKNGQFLPIESALEGQGATIGGAIACNTSGALRLSVGPARDWLIGVKFILADGTFSKGGGRVVKNVAGFDMMKLFIGSLGTLGLIYEMNFKLLPLPPQQATLLVPAQNYEQACQLALQLIELGTFPASLTVLDIAAAHQLGLQADKPLLVTQVRNTVRAVERQVRDISAACRTATGNPAELIDDLPRQRQLEQAITDFGYSALPPGGFALKIGSLPDQSASIAAQATKLAQLAGIEIAMLSHAGHGISWLTAQGGSSEVAAKFIKGLAAVVEPVGGSLTAERVPIELKEHLEDVWGTALSEGELKLMRDVKLKLDPKRTLNPGRFVARI